MRLFVIAPFLVPVFAFAAKPVSKTSLDATKVAVDSVFQGTKGNNTFFNAFVASMRANPVIREVVVVNNEKGADTAVDQYGVKTITETKHLFIDLKNTRDIPVLLVQVDTKYIECPSTTTTCIATEYFNVKGPISTYGNTRKLTNIEALLKNKQSFQFTATPGTSSFTVRAEFTVTSVKFEESVMRLSREFLGSDSTNLTQNQMLSAMGRFLRTVNEGMYQ